MTWSKATLDSIDPERVTPAMLRSIMPDLSEAVEGRSRMVPRKPTLEELDRQAIVARAKARRERRALDRR